MCVGPSAAERERARESLSDHALRWPVQLLLVVDAIGLCVSAV